MNESKSNRVFKLEQTRTAADQKKDYCDCRCHWKSILDFHILSDEQIIAFAETMIRMVPTYAEDLERRKANQELMRKSNFQNMLSTADTKQIRTTAQSLNDNQDIERLGWLQELASFRGDDMLSNSLEAQINGVRDANLTDEQKSFKAISERIQKSMKLFNYSIERSKTGVFVDARNDEAPSPS